MTKSDQLFLVKREMGMVKIGMCRCTISPWSGRPSTIHTQILDMILWLSRYKTIHLTFPLSHKQLFKNIFSVFKRKRKREANVE